MAKFQTYLKKTKLMSELVFVFGQKALCRSNGKFRMFRILALHLCHQLQIITMETLKCRKNQLDSESEKTSIRQVIIRLACCKFIVSVTSISKSRSVPFVTIYSSGQSQIHVLLPIFCYDHMCLTLYFKEQFQSNMAESRNGAFTRRSLWTACALENQRLWSKKLKRPTENGPLTCYISKQIQKMRHTRSYTIFCQSVGGSLLESLTKEQIIQPCQKLLKRVSLSKSKIFCLFGGMKQLHRSPLGVVYGLLMNKRLIIYPLFLMLTCQVDVIKLLAFSVPRPRIIKQI